MEGRRHVVLPRERMAGPGREPRGDVREGNPRGRARAAQDALVGDARGREANRGRGRGGRGRALAQVGDVQGHADEREGQSRRRQQRRAARNVERRTAVLAAREDAPGALEPPRALSTEGTTSMQLTCTTCLATIDAGTTPESLAAAMAGSHVRRASREHDARGHESGEDGGPMTDDSNGG